MIGALMNDLLIHSQDGRIKLVRDSSGRLEFGRHADCSSPRHICRLGLMGEQAEFSRVRVHAGI